MRLQHAVASGQQQGYDQEVPRARTPQLRKLPQPSNAQLAGPASECMYAEFRNCLYLEANVLGRANFLFPNSILGSADE